MFLKKNKKKQIYLFFCNSCKKILKHFWMKTIFMLLATCSRSCSFLRARLKKAFAEV